jgi:hypothetical protein
VLFVTSICIVIEQSGGLKAVETMIKGMRGIDGSNYTTETNIMHNVSSISCIDRRD